ncbi:hypothetical protein ACFO25_06245 [Paenactinomyces guangxiensis]|uniref:Uncharacterized protein n=1 Tax=Paenactinomyces guangxiensis TaxID=1490290 RepID=A0A7W2AAL3_9BACL|nr:hypothetical protein [Paenactinomyces guangxiensis]MBA4496324.1 hypothetical protein [Paenactinomyces guangxiensis]MBH8590853.1 hypothetical protein [Paenactinomyces guangxiensis]
MGQKKGLARGESDTIKKGEAVGFVVYVMAKLGYSRLQIEEVTRELRSCFNMKCRNYVFDSNLTAGRTDRINLLPTIAEQNNKKDR